MPYVGIFLDSWRLVFNHKQYTNREKLLQEILKKSTALIFLQSTKNTSHRNTLDNTMSQNNTLCAQHNFLPSLPFCLDVFTPFL